MGVLVVELGVRRKVLEGGCWGDGHGVRKTVVHRRKVRIHGEGVSGGVPAWGLWQGGSWKEWGMSSLAFSLTAFS